MDKLQWKSWYREERIKRRPVALKDIPGLEGLYAITEDGKVWSYPKKWRKQMCGGKFLVQARHNGYCRVDMIGKKGVIVHRIVAQTFIPNPENKPFVNHKNGIKDDNRVENLEWVTAKENTWHSNNVLGNKKTKQEYAAIYSITRKVNSKRVGRFTLSGMLIDEFSSGKTAAKILGYHQTGISAVARGQKYNKTYKGYMWKYL